MKKANITISYDEEKVKALRWYLQQKGLQLEDELVQTIEAMFAKNVPASVRSYITRDLDAPADGDAPKTQKKVAYSKETTENG